jgi:8-oxo-dGTP pyrophosphatase MutT (NUDIX family)
MDKTRDTRYQAAILRGAEILLIKHREHADGRSYWVLPGGRMEADETEMDCVRREVLEETSLEVSVADLLLDEPPLIDNGGPYQRFKTYLCHPLTAEAAPGYEPELDAAAVYAIVEVAWFRLADETTWDDIVLNDPITAPLLRRVRAALEKMNAMPAENDHNASQESFNRDENAG